MEKEILVDIINELIQEIINLKNVLYPLRDIEDDENLQKILRLIN